MRHVITYRYLGFPRRTFPNRYDVDIEAMDLSIIFFKAFTSSNLTLPGVNTDHTKYVPSGLYRSDYRLVLVQWPGVFLTKVLQGCFLYHVYCT